MSARGTVLTAEDPRHGTPGGYTNWRCRCSRCKGAWAAHVREQRAQRKARGLPPDDPRHGRRTSYSNWNCRCLACTLAWAAYRRELGRRRAVARMRGAS